MGREKCMEILLNFTRITIRTYLWIRETVSLFYDFLVFIIGTNGLSRSANNLGMIFFLDKRILYERSF